ncbi:MAG: Flp pilus assembly protein CpaB [Oligoflexia bacterium]|nr:Flp pilus assembly protein CpaB [Oligoflexia bacterium]
MNQNSRTFWISIGAALFAMFLIYSYTQEQKAVYDKKFGSTKTVLIAAKDILEMSSIDETMVTQEERPTDFLQPGAVESPEDVVGLVAATPIKKGEQIILTKLLAPGPSTGLAHQVALNKRAITIPVDEVRGVGKLIRPGDRIDVLTSISYGDGKNERREVKTLLQDILVLATGLNVTNNIPRILELDNFNGKPVYKNLNGDTGYSTVTVEVNPDEAQNLVYILSVAPGSIFLTLRNGNDKVLQRIATSTVDRVLGMDSDRSLQLQLQKAQAAAAAQQQQQQQQPRQPASPFSEIRGSDVKY